MAKAAAGAGSADSSVADQLREVPDALEELSQWLS
jgi:hypothetical protein